MINTVTTIINQETTQILKIETTIIQSTLILSKETEPNTIQTTTLQRETTQIMNILSTIINQETTNPQNILKIETTIIQSTQIISKETEPNTIQTEAQKITTNIATTTIEATTEAVINKETQEIIETNKEETQKVETQNNSEIESSISKKNSLNDVIENQDNDDKSQEDNIPETESDKNSENQIENDDQINENNKIKDSSKDINTPVTPATPITPFTPFTPSSSISKRSTMSKVMKFQKKKEMLMQKGKNKFQERSEKNRIRYLTEEEINLAFQWFTDGRNVITSEDIKNCFDMYFTDISKNDKKYYVEGGIKHDTRHLINTKEEKVQSEMFNSSQSITSLKKMLLKYPFKMKDYDNAFSILCGGDLEESISKETLNEYINILRENEVPIKNDIDKILRCFDKDKAGLLSDDKDDETVSFIKFDGLPVPCFRNDVLPILFEY